MYAYVYACIRILCMYVCMYAYVSHRRRGAKKSQPTRSSSVYYLHKVKYVAGTWVPQAKKKSSRKKAATNFSPVTTESQTAAGDVDASALIRESESRFDVTQVLRRLSAALLCALVCSACLVYPCDTVLRCADDR